MTNNHELENQNLRPTTTGDNSDSTCLPGKELPEQDLDAVSGGIIGVLPAIDEVVKHPNQTLDEGVSDPIAGGLVDAPIAAENAINNFSEMF